MVNAINACHIENDAPANENRIAPRETLESEIFIQQSGNKLCRVTLSNISESGFRMTSKRNLDHLQPIFIRLPGIPSLSATIRWEGFKDYGCQFSQPLTANIYARLLSKLKSLDTEA